MQASLYYLGGSSDGSMKTGWQKVNGNWYYLNGSGAALTGWQQIGGSWYYFENDHVLVSDTVKQIAGRTLRVQCGIGVIDDEVILF